MLKSAPNTAIGACVTAWAAASLTTSPVSACSASCSACSSSCSFAETAIAAMLPMAARPAATSQ
jgi:hypothetical protein